MSICNNLCFIIANNRYLFIIKIFMLINIKTKIKEIVCHMCTYTWHNKVIYLKKIQAKEDRS